MEKIRIKSVKYNFAMNIILKLSSIIFPLITLPYVTRVLGAAGNGRVAFAASVISYFSMFAQLGIPTYAIRACAKVRDNPDDLTKTVHEILIINSISVILTYIVFIVCIAIIPRFQQERLLLVINSLTIGLNMIGMEWFYQSIEQYRYITIRNLAFKILLLVLMFILIKKPEDYIVYGSLTVISSVGSNIFNLLHSRKYLIGKKYKGYSIKPHLRPILYFFAVSIAVSIYTNMDTVMLGFMCTDEQVGYYNIATKVKLVLITVITALGPVLLPRISNCLARNMYEDFHQLLSKSLHFVLLLVLPITSYFVIFARDAVDVLGGNEYYPAVLTMRIILFTLIPMGVGNVACMQILAPLGMERFTMYSTIVGAMINLFANMLLIPYYGAAGASIATVLAEIIVATIQVYYSRNIIVKIVNKIDIKKILFSNIIVIGIMLVLSKILNLVSIINLALSVVIVSIMYVVILILVKDSLVYDAFKTISKIKESRTNGL